MSDRGLHLTVTEENAGQRIDAWLAQALQEEGVDASRNQVQTWLAAGLIGGPQRRLKASDKVAPGETYEVVQPEPTAVDVQPEQMDLDIVYEDDDVVVVNKPRGLVVHPGAGHETGTLINGLMGRGTQLSALGGELRPGVVHRIDKDTSGLLMLAKTDLAYHGLSLQLRSHTAERVYKAIVHGEIQHANGTIDAPIARDLQNRQRMAVRENGKHAVTHFHVLRRYHGYTYVELKLETGRTHQIRVHMAYIEFPLAGDPVYGPRHTLPIVGQALHAAILGFVHPRTKRELQFETAVPEDITRLFGMMDALEP